MKKEWQEKIQKYQRKLGLDGWKIEVFYGEEKMGAPVEVEVRDGWEKEAEVWISKDVKDKDWAIVRGLMEIACEDVVQFCLWNLDERDFVEFQKKFHRVLDVLARFLR